MLAFLKLTPKISTFNLQMMKHFALCCCPSDTEAGVLLVQLSESALNSFYLFHNTQENVFTHFICV